jgi:two-component system, sensor histidine kinase and response regulator
MFAVFSLSSIIYTIRLLQLKKRQIELQNAVTNSAGEILNKNRELEMQRDEIELKNRQLEVRKSEIEGQATELQKQQDILKAMNVSKDRLLSVIAHDLRTPIGNISNLLDMINAQSDYLSEEKKKRLMSNLSDVTKSTYDLIENLLEWSKAQHGLISYNPVRLFVLPIINEAINLLYYAAEKKHINIRIDMEETTLVYADANMTRTILRNLIANAIKFSKDNAEVKIHAETRDGMVLFSVHDTGRGMTPQQMEYLFVEIDKSGTQTAGNSGLGLILCKEFAEMNGGEIWAKSNPGEGSIFYFTLPVAQ